MSSIENERISDANRYSDMLGSADRQIEAEFARVNEIVKLCKAGDMSVKPEWSTTTILGKSVKREIGYVLTEALDYGNGPSVADLIAVLCKVAYGTEPQQEAARSLINAMATVHAYHNVETE